jgi:hypothetical protein
LVVSKYRVGASMKQSVVVSRFFQYRIQYFHSPIEVFVAVLMFGNRRNGNFESKKPSLDKKRRVLPCEKQRILRSFFARISRKF